MNTELAAKLRLTLIALGGISRSDLVERFRAANPATQCELNCLHKWIQGRAQPRSAQLYDDWAKVIGSRRSAGWLASSGLDAFAAELASLTGISAKDLQAHELLNEQGAPAWSGGARSLCGTFACYNISWSTHYAGKIVRRALRLLLDANSAFKAVLSASLAGRKFHWTGSVIMNRVLCLDLRADHDGSALFMTLTRPGPPASVMSGIQCGCPTIAQQALPTALRILIVRVPETPQLDATNGAFDPRPDYFADDLCALGLKANNLTELASSIRDFLDGRALQVTPGQHAQLCARFDPLWLSRSRRVER